MKLMIFLTRSLIFLDLKGPLLDRPLERNVSLFLSWILVLMAIYVWARAGLSRLRLLFQALGTCLQWRCCTRYCNCYLFRLTETCWRYQLAGTLLFIFRLSISSKTIVPPHSATKNMFTIPSLSKDYDLPTVLPSIHSTGRRLQSWKMFPWNH